MPIGTYISIRIMELAETELRKGDKSIKEISDRLGFRDQFYFSKCFTAHYGITPKKYISSCFI